LAVLVQPLPRFFLPESALNTLRFTLPPPQTFSMGVRCQKTSFLLTGIDFGAFDDSKNGLTLRHYDKVCFLD
jgi:hypothetical protein